MCVCMFVYEMKGERESERRACNGYIIDIKSTSYTLARQNWVSRKET